LSITAPLAFSLEKNQEQEPEKRRQILDGATRVFLNTGYEGASMSVIAQAAGVSKGTLYVYFTNKEALFNAVVENYCQIHAEHVFDSLYVDTAPLDVALFDCGRRYATALTNARPFIGSPLQNRPSFPSWGACSSRPARNSASRG
jgi:AcrR family transcriptional regulator